MCLSLDQTCYLADCDGFSHAWVNKQQCCFCISIRVILQDLGVEVLPRHPCFVGRYFKAIVIFFSYYSSWNIMPFPNPVQLKFPSTSNLSVRREGQNASQRHTSSANQNIFHGPCTLEKTKGLMERNAYNTFKGFGKSDTV